MKSIKLILITIIGLFLTANVFGQVQVVVPDPDNTDATTTYKKLHIVAKGSKYTYSVDKHYTLTLDQIILNTLLEDGNVNRYAWEVLKLEGADESKDPIEYANAISLAAGSEIIPTSTFVDPNLQYNIHPIEWKKELESGDYYLIRVIEYPNHNTESLEKDEEAGVVSEIVVRIGDDLQIYMVDDDANNINKNFYACNGEGIDISNIDDADKAGKMKIKVNGRPGITANGDEIDGWKVTFKVTRYNKGAAEAPQNVTVNHDAVVQGEDGYYDLEFGLKDMDGDISFNLEDPDSDIYYAVELVEAIDGDKNPVAPEAGLAGDTKKIKRIYGIYAKPKVTKINFK